MAKQIKYTEPTGYFPKEIREKYFGKGKSTSTGTKKTVKKTGKKK